MDAPLGKSTAAVLASTKRRLSLTGGVGNGIGASVVVGYLLFLVPSTLEPCQPEVAIRYMIKLKR